jgi:hypothetical protein
VNRQRVKISPLGWRLLGVLMELGEDALLTLCNSVRADTTQSVATLRELVSAGLVCGSKHRLTSGRSWFEEVGTTEATAFLEAAAKNIRAAMAA